jgi:hypothetical protein
MARCGGRWGKRTRTASAEKSGAVPHGERHERKTGGSDKR